MSPLPLASASPFSVAVVVVLGSAAGVTDLALAEAAFLVSTGVADFGLRGVAFFFFDGVSSTSSSLASATVQISEFRKHHVRGNVIHFLRLLAGVFFTAGFGVPASGVPLASPPPFSKVVTSLFLMRVNLSRAYFGVLQLAFLATASQLTWSVLVPRYYLNRGEVGNSYAGAAALAHEGIEDLEFTSCEIGVSHAASLCFW